VRSESTKEKLDGVSVDIYSGYRFDREADLVYGLYSAITNGEGYFEITVPEREKYKIWIVPPGADRALAKEQEIKRPNKNEILTFDWK
jgi:hypothetical protein